MLAPLAAALLSLALAAPPQCPDNQGTAFIQFSKSIQGIRLLGADSYGSLFVGQSFKEAIADDGPAPAGDARFWLGRLMVQWKLVEAAAFDPPAGATDDEKLEAHYEYEFGFLKELVDRGKVRIANPKVFRPFDVKGDRGELHQFKVWQVTIGQQLEAAQFWITTPHPRGIVVLSIIAPLQEAAAAKAVIDSYMTNFGRVSAATCQRLQEAALEDGSKGDRSLPESKVSR